MSYLSVAMKDISNFFSARHLMDFRSPHNFPINLSLPKGQGTGAGRGCWRSRVN